jgi:transposase
MATAVEITRIELSAEGLRQAASGLRDGAIVRRVLALVMVLDGASRTEAAEACGMDRQTLRDWVHRYNEQGIAGLGDRARPGRPPTPTTEQRAELKALVVQGPEPERDGVVRWRCADLRAVPELAAMLLGSRPLATTCWRSNPPRPCGRKVNSCIPILAFDGLTTASLPCR